MSKKDDRIKLTPTAAKDHLLQYFSNCEMQIKTNQRPTSLCIEGAAGIAKTSLVKQMATEMGYKLHQINAAMIDDLGHLVGFPQKQYQFADHSGENIWVSAEFSDEAMKTGIPTGESRMNYAVPYWLKDVEPNEKFILLLDDFTRGLPMVMQACMTLVEEYRYGSWELPKNSIIMLTTNPDNGEYSVASLDTAQKTRMRYIEMVFETERWARWAESQNMDSRCINFVLHNPELFHTKNDGIGGAKEYNARIMTKFFNDIGCLPDFSVPQALSYVKICGDGSVGNRFTDMFLTFINDRLDKLPSPKELMGMKQEDALKALNAVCGNYQTKSAYQPATASIMASRITNYAIYGDQPSWGKDENTKVISMILHNSFSEDLKFYMARQFVTDAAKKQSAKLQLITMHPDIMKMIFS